MMRSVLAVLVLAGVLLAALPVLAAAPAPKTDVSPQMARVKAFKDLTAQLEVYKSGQAVDWAAAKELYISALRPTVQARDTEFKQQLDVAITGALDAGAAGQLSAGVVKQLVDKLLQKVFYLSVKHEFIVAVENLGKGDQPRAIHNIDEAIAYFEALRGTVQKRDQAFRLTMEAAIDGMLATAQEEVARGNAAALVNLGIGVEYTILRTFYLAGLGYAEKTPATAETDEAAARITMAEGWAFLQSLQGVVEAPHFATVEAMFNPVQGNPKQVSKQTYVNELGLGLLAHARGQLQVAAANLGKPEAQVAALKAGFALQILEADLAAALKAVGGSTLDATLQAFTGAVASGDKAGAQTQIDLALRAVDFLAATYAGTANQVVLKIGSTTISLLGQSKQIEAAPFVVKGRTMVPIRFVAEALGAQVTWLSATETVQIVLGARAILLPVGQAEAMVDGKAILLDVPAQVVNGRAFVPVRFVSEVLGAEVTWQAETETVIIKPAK